MLSHIRISSLIVFLFLSMSISSICVLFAGWCVGREPSARLSEGKRGVLFTPLSALWWRISRLFLVGTHIGVLEYYFGASLPGGGIFRSSFSLFIFPHCCAFALGGGEMCVFLELVGFLFHSTSCELKLMWGLGDPLLLTKFSLL